MVRRTAATGTSIICELVGELVSTSSSTRTAPGLGAPRCEPRTWLIWSAREASRHHVGCCTMSDGEMLIARPRREVRKLGSVARQPRAAGRSGAGSAHSHLDAVAYSALGAELNRQHPRDRSVTAKARPSSAGPSAAPRMAAHDGPPPVARKWGSRAPSERPPSSAQTLV